MKMVSAHIRIPAAKPTFLAVVAVLAVSMVVPILVVQAEPVPGYEYRKPRSEADLRDWLQNMVWYHRFSIDEIKSATGLPETEITEAIEKFNIPALKRGLSEMDAPLLVLPWPGGRAVSNWGGTVEPTRQRETKATVFAPWDPASYVVVDVPEAIWSNLGLAYLAHVDVPTIWTEQGIELEKLEWNRCSDGGLVIERKLPNKITYTATILPFQNALRMKLTLTNGTDSILRGLRVQNCVFLKGMKGFENESKPKTVSSQPYNAHGTADGTRWVITAWIPVGHTWSNEKNPCFHSDPTFDDCPPNQTCAAYGWLSFYEGDDIEGEFKRIEKTEWRSNLWKDQPRWQSP